MSIQVREDCSGDLNYWHRHISKGGWPFSTPDNGWPVSDCTAEGLKVHFLFPKNLFPEAICYVRMWALNNSTNKTSYDGNVGAIHDHMSVEEFYARTMQLILKKKEKKGAFNNASKF